MNRQQIILTGVLTCSIFLQASTAWSQWLPARLEVTGGLNGDKIPQALIGSWKTIPGSFVQYELFFEFNQSKSGFVMYNKSLDNDMKKPMNVRIIQCKNSSFQDILLACIDTTSFGQLGLAGSQEWYELSVRENDLEFLSLGLHSCDIGKISTKSCQIRVSEEPSLLKVVKVNGSPETYESFFSENYSLFFGPGSVKTIYRRSASP